MASQMTVSNVSELNELVNELRASGRKVQVQKQESGFLVTFETGVPMTKPKPKSSKYSGFSGFVPFANKSQAEAEYNKIKPEFGELVRLKGSRLVFMTTRDYMASRVGAI